MLYSVSPEFRFCWFQFEDDVGLLWRLARALFHLSNHLEQEGDTEGQKQLIEEGKLYLFLSQLLPPSLSGLELCQRGLELDDGVWQVHQWYAITIGSLTKYEGTQRKIEMGYQYKVPFALTSLSPSLSQFSLYISLFRST